MGAACAVYRDGPKVVGLWGGYRDGVTRSPWEEDTVVVMYSTTKGVSSLALALQRPLWTAGTRHGYHTYSLGWYEGELLRRVDPQRRSQRPR